MKYLKLFENLNIIIKPTDYVKELNLLEFEFLLKNNCKNFDFNDKMLIRGDKKLNSDYYYVNGKNRIVDYLNNRMFPIHLEFMKSKKWDGLPKKDKSIDLTTSDNKMVSSGNYGNVYRVIPYDNAIFVSSEKLIGNYNKIINIDLNLSFISNFIENLISFHNEYFEYSYDSKKIVNNLNKLFKNESLSDNASNIIKKFYNILKDKNMSFIEYMEYAYSPDNYQIMNYDDLLETTGLFSWTDNPVLLKKI